jgi:hypothetical protein
VNRGNKISVVVKIRMLMNVIGASRTSDRTLRDCSRLAVRGAPFSDSGTNTGAIALSAGPDEF